MAKFMVEIEGLMKENFPKDKFCENLWLRFRERKVTAKSLKKILREAFNSKDLHIRSNGTFNVTEIK